VESAAKIGKQQNVSGLRKFGVDLVGAVPFGTHLCQFYETKKDLIDILVPYFAEGLRSNEFCLWVTSPPLEVDEAKEAIRNAVPDLEAFVAKGQIEIISYNEWYLLGGKFDSKRVPQGWVDKENAALKRGFEGLRLSGNTFWIDRSLWQSFVDYEEAVNVVIGGHKMLALCTYCLKNCSGNDVLDVVRNHVGTLIKQGKKWGLVENVARRRKAEVAFKASEAQYLSLFSNMMDGFAHCKMIFDEEGKPVDFVYLQINDAFERITGLKRDVVIGKRVTVAIPGIKKANPELFEIYGRVALTGKDERFEIFFKPLSLWLSVSVYSPKKGYFAAVFEDISERKKSEETLRESEKRIARSQEIAHLGSWELDLISNQLSWSDEVYRIFGLKPQEFGATYEAFLDAVHPEDRAAVNAAYVGSLSDGKDTYEIEHRVVRKSTGEIRVVQEKCEHFRDESGRIIRSIGMVQDITERKKVEQALQQAKLDWERTFDSVPDFIAILDNEHRIVRANQAMAQKLGVTPEQCIGLNCYSCVHGTTIPPECCPHSKSVKDGKEHIAEVLEPRLGGYFLVSTTPLRDKQGLMVGTVHVARNITERKQMQNKLEEYAAHLEDLVQERTQQLKDTERLTAIGETAGMVGHDLRNPLQTVTGETYLAKTELNQLPDSPAKRNLEESLQSIEDQINYMDKIVSDLQDFVRPITPEKTHVNLEKLIRATVTEVAIPTNVEVQTQIDEYMPEVAADAQLLKRVFFNLLNNALQAMPKGGILTLKMQSIKNLKGDGKILICVEDTGVGIPEEVKPKIFKPLFTTKSRGQGFGLVVCKRVIEAHGGAITFESEEGKGTNFTVELPIENASAT